MSFAWGDFSTLARELIDNSGESEVPEAAIRASLGRSYYAVFGVARNMVREDGETVARHSAHASLRRILAESTDARRRRAARALSRLFRLRIEADYYASPGIPLTRELAEEACLVAEAALQTLRLPDEPDPQQGRP